ncbi:SapB/AmfS family lanthipeptide [Streptomyces sp. NPDC049555]
MGETMVLLDLQVMRPDEGEEALLQLGRSIGDDNSELSVILCHEE